MTKTQKILITAASLYAVAGVIAFGDAMNRFTRWRDANCATLKQRLESPGTACYGPQGLEAFATSLVWPLYASYRLQSDD